jgi:hypothetical protein
LFPKRPNYTGTYDLFLYGKFFNEKSGPLPLSEFTGFVLEFNKSNRREKNKSERRKIK